MQYITKLTKLNLFLQPSRLSLAFCISCTYHRVPVHVIEPMTDIVCEENCPKSLPLPERVSPKIVWYDNRFGSFIWTSLALLWDYILLYNTFRRIPLSLLPKKDYVRFNKILHILLLGLSQKVQFEGNWRGDLSGKVLACKHRDLNLDSQYHIKLGMWCTHLEPWHWGLRKGQRQKDDVRSLVTLASRWALDSMRPCL